MKLFRVTFRGRATPLSPAETTLNVVALTGEAALKVARSLVPDGVNLMTLEMIAEVDAVDISK